MERCYIEPFKTGSKITGEIHLALAVITCSSLPHPAQSRAKRAPPAKEAPAPEEGRVLAEEGERYVGKFSHFLYPHQDSSPGAVSTQPGQRRRSPTSGPGLCHSHTAIRHLTDLSDNTQAQRKRVRAGGHRATFQEHVQGGRATVPPA